MKILIGDIETNGLHPNIIWAVGIVDYDTDEYTAYVGEDEVPLGLMRLAEADLVVGHYFRGFDAPQIERLTEGLIKFRPDQIDDTVEISRALFPELKSHKLREWGEILGYPKLESPSFDEFTPELLPYLERDVRLNKALYQFFLDHIASLDSKAR